MTTAAPIHFTEVIYVSRITLAGDHFILSGSYEHPLTDCTPASFRISFTLLYTWLSQYNHFVNGNSLLSKLADTISLRNEHADIAMEGDNNLILFGLIFRLVDNASVLYIEDAVEKEEDLYVSRNALTLACERVHPENPAALSGCMLALALRHGYYLGRLQLDASADAARRLALLNDDLIFTLSWYCYETLSKM